ncbi:MAG TPA: VWA domain-containing protein [Blastocatellia bacterium]|nr:VWA domain-containing protein [Blastocatellia bacterium]HMG35807.1 VWA domain-containing protein [Blastocatellia bacterium]
MRNDKADIKPLVATFLLLFQFAVRAQQPNTSTEKTQRDKELIFSRYPIISFDALALSHIGKSVVTNLTRDDFTILENGIKQDIFAWRRPPAPLSFLLVIDPASDDTNANALDHQLSTMKASLIARLNSNDEVSVELFGERPTLLQDYTSDKQLINDALDRVSQQRLVSTMPIDQRLSNGLKEAAQHARFVQNPEARRVIILISDSAEKIRDLLISPEAVRAIIGPVPIIFCWNVTGHLDFQVLGESQYSLNKISLLNLVQLTGGEFVNNEWEAFIEQMRGRYWIAYLPSAQRRGGELVKIEVQLKPSPKTKHQ